MKLNYFILFFIILNYKCVFTQSSRSEYKEVYISKIPFPKLAPELKISDITFNEDNNFKNNALDALENANITFIIQNVGKGTAYQCMINISQNKNIDGLNFKTQKYIGDIEPNAEFKVIIPISGSKNLSNNKADFNIIVNEGNNFNSDVVNLLVNTISFKTPDIVVVETKFTTPFAGKATKKSQINLQLLVQNQGQGNAKNVSINISTPENVLALGESKFILENLLPNETKILSYDFIANSLYNDSIIPISINIQDNYTINPKQFTANIALNKYLDETKKIDLIANSYNNIPITTVSLISDVDKNIPNNKKIYNNKYALIIGNEDYKSYQTNLSSEINVPYARNDANIFSEYANLVLGIPKNQIHLVLDATSAKMKQEIEWLSNLASLENGNAEIYFYYAGHGLPNEVTKEPFLIPVDVSGKEITDAISLNETIKKLNNSVSKKVVLFLDACFSGGARNLPLLTTRGIKIKPKTIDMLSGNTLIFSSSTGDQSSSTFIEKQHGYFTYFLLKKLQENNSNLTYKDLKDDVYFNVKKSTTLDSKLQEPQLIISTDLENKWENWKVY